MARQSNNLRLLLPVTTADGNHQTQVFAPGHNMPPPPPPGQGPANAHFGTPHGGYDVPGAHVRSMPNSNGLPPMHVQPPGLNSPEMQSMYTPAGPQYFHGYPTGQIHFHVTPQSAQSLFTPAQSGVFQAHQALFFPPSCMCDKLEIEGDDIDKLTNAEFDRLVNKLYNALTADPAPATDYNFNQVGAEMYTNAMNKALQGIKAALLDPLERGKAEARCTLVVYNAVLIHQNGTTSTGTAAKHEVDRKSIFSTRVDKLIESVRKNKLLALDLVCGRILNDLAHAPVECLDNKMKNAGSNAQRKKKKAEEDAAREAIQNGAAVPAGGDQKKPSNKAANDDAQATGDAAGGVVPVIKTVSKRSTAKGMKRTNDDVDGNEEDTGQPAKKQRGVELPNSSFPGMLTPAATTGGHTTPAFDGMTPQSFDNQKSLASKSFSGIWPGALISSEDFTAAPFATSCFEPHELDEQMSPEDLAARRSSFGIDGINSAPSERYPNSYGVGPEAGRAAPTSPFAAFSGPDRAQGMVQSHVTSPQEEVDVEVVEMATKPAKTACKASAKKAKAEKKKKSVAKASKAAGAASQVLRPKPITSFIQNYGMPHQFSANHNNRLLDPTHPRPTKPSNYHAGTPQYGQQVPENYTMNMSSVPGANAYEFDPSNLPLGATSNRFGNFDPSSFVGGPQTPSPIRTTSNSQYVNSYGSQLTYDDTYGSHARSSNLHRPSSGLVNTATASMTYPSPSTSAGYYASDSSAAATSGLTHASTTTPEDFNTKSPSHEALQDNDTDLAFLQQFQPLLDQAGMMQSDQDVGGSGLRGPGDVFFGTDADSQQTGYVTGGLEIGDEADKLPVSNASETNQVPQGEGDNGLQSLGGHLHQQDDVAPWEDFDCNWGNDGLDFGSGEFN